MSLTRRRLGFLALAILAFSCLACSSDAPAKTADDVASAPRVSKSLSVDELLPADLDLVVRIDLARLRRNIPADAVDLAFAALEKDALLATAMRAAKVVTVGVRVEDLESGDRVLGLEGSFEDFPIDEELYVFEKTANEKLGLWKKKSRAMRDGVALIAKESGRTLWFVSPVERDGVLRVVASGPDERRGIPQAEGIFSVDYRPRRLSPKLEEQFPSIGRLIAEVVSVRMTVDVEERGLVLEGKIAAKSEAYAQRVLAFLGTLRDLAPSYALALRSMKTDVAGHVVHFEVALPPAALARVLSSVEATPANPEDAPSEPPAVNPEPGVVPDHAVP